MKIQVQVIQGPAANRTFVVEKNMQCVVGRGEEADFQIENDSLISREHFVIGFDGQAIMLKDLGSTNGTFVDGEALVKDRPVYLGNGHVFIAGRTSQFLVNVISIPQVAPGAGQGVPAGQVPAPVPQSTPQPMPDPVSSAGQSGDDAGGNFSQSIVNDISGTPRLGAGADGGPKEQSGLLFSNNFTSTSSIDLNVDDIGAERFSDSTKPPPIERPSHEPISHQRDQPQQYDTPQERSDPAYYGSIAPPGMGVGGRPKFEPLGPDPSALSQPTSPPTPPPTPQLSPPVPQPLSPAETQSSSPFSDSIASPGPSSPAQPAPPRPAAPVPTEEGPSEEGPSEKPTTRIALPTDVAYDDPADAYASQATPVHPHSPQAVVAAPSASIGLPGQVHVAPKVVEQRPLEQSSMGVAESPPGQFEFEMRTLNSGLFVFSGTNDEDLPRVLAALQKSNETVFCLDRGKAGLVSEPVEAEPPPSNDDASTKDPKPADSAGQSPVASGDDSGDEKGGSNFVDGDDTIGSSGSDGKRSGASPNKSKLDSPIKGEAGHQSPFDDDDPREGTDDGGVSSPFSKENDNDEKQKKSSDRIGTPLFAWFPPDLRWSNPVLQTEEEFECELADVWHSDALVCWFGSSAQQITEHCLELIQTNPRNGKKGETMFGFCWPSVLEGVLESQPAKTIDLIFSGGVAAILLEDPGGEFSWKIASKNDLKEMLQAAGFTQQQVPANPPPA